MSTAIDTIAMEMMVPAEDESPPTPLGSIDGTVEAVEDVVGDGLGDLDFDGFGVALTVFVGVGVGVGDRVGRPWTTTVPFIPAWIEQW
jgi:hypothetical protein